MDDRILSSVVEITEQRNSISLGHCLLATLTEMMPVQSACLTHFIANTRVVIAKVTKSETEHHYDWVYEPNLDKNSYHDHARSTPTTEKISKSHSRISYPIPISDDNSAELVVDIDGEASNYQLLIDGFAKIYKNYLVVLHESERDKLTGLLNRRTLEERLSQSFDLVSPREGGEHMWVAIIDLDHFKSINDQFGHMIGDEILLMFSQQMQNYFCDNEQLFRFGGEEFVVLLPQQDQSHAYDKLEGFRKHIEKYRFPQVQQITLSCGLCAISRHEYLPTILGYADKALYLAKTEGRNQIRSYDELAKDNRQNQDIDPFSDVELF